MRQFFALFTARSRALTTSVALVLGACTGVLALSVPAASAATTANVAKAATTATTLPSTVSADPLPTVQENGVVWSEVTVGNIVYATGSFSQTWPAGTSNTAANDTARGNLLAFNITTGALVTSFNHSLNAQGLFVTASPDGSTVYVGGDFTTVDGVARNRIAAFSTATGALLTSFKPGLSGEVDAISATSSTVYVGGNFTSSGGVSRTKLAAFSASTGALLSWAPTAENGEVAALVVTPDQSEVVVGGRFPTLNGVNVYGLGAVDAVSGATLPYAANQYIRDYTTVGSSNGNGSGINSLTTDGSQVYGSGFSFNEGNFEGTFALSPDTGAINVVNDCHGDTYGVAAVGQVLYDVSHEHDCSAVGAFPDTNPRVWHHATAFTTYATGTDTGPDSYGWNYNGLPDSTLLPWYPTLALGSVTGQSQAAWSVTGNSNYLALGGEFPSANGVAQAGLVRYAVRSLAPNKVGPETSKTLTPSVVSLSSGTVRVAWQATWDQDDPTLTYNVLRDGSTTPVYTTTQTSSFWQLPAMGFTDSGLSPGSTHTYRVQVVDPSGNKITSASVTATVSSTAPSAYVGDVQSDGAGDLWRFNEASGTTAYDWAGFNDMTEGAGVTDGTAGPLSDSATAASFNGTSTGTASTTAPVTGPNTFSVEAWFKTTSTSGGKIVGFGNATAGNVSGNYDRHIYMTNAGQLVFGVFNNATYTITSPKAYNDGQWHQVIGELSGAGMALYVDGKPVGQNQGTTIGQPYTGYWSVGGDNLNGWPSQPSSNYFAGAIGDVAVYPTALSISQVQKHYTDSGRTLTTAPVPTDAYGAAVYNANPQVYWRLDEAGGSTAKDTSPYQNDGTYSSGVTYQVPSTVTGANGTGIALNGQATVVASQATTNPTVYSEQLWFNTTTSTGGRLIGFGNQPSGNSNSYDRMVWMLNSGQLEFGAYNGNLNTVTSSNAYNDGKWHELVATQGPDGMTLYVDGQAVGTNPDTVSQNYAGYWRLGADNTWGGNSSPGFTGKIDEAAVYGSELSAGQVQSQYNASSVGHAAPTASFTANCSSLTCSLDASNSTASSGSITSDAWSFSDGGSTTGAKASYTFASGGTYKITLTVTDSFGATSSTSQSVTVAAPTAPTASFATPNCTNLTCTFDASGSTDPSGTITGYAWSFSDGGTATGVTPSHTFASSGNVSATLTVTDSGDNLSGTSTQNFSVSGPSAPTAAFSSNCTYLSCTFDASGSSDPSGTISGYSWTFPNGDTASGKTTSYTFASAGAQQVKLVVSDSGTGLSNSVTNTANPSAPPGPPTAAFTSNCTALQCAFDASSSTATGTGATITGYSWNFGDTTNGTGQTASDTYQAAGDYTVTLTVTDSNNRTGQVSHVVSPRPAANPSIALYGSDGFNRTVTSGWGTADTGGAWTPTGTTAGMSVSNGVGSLTMAKPSSGPGAYLANVSKTDSATFATIGSTAAPSGGAIYLDVLGRRISNNVDYRGRINLKPGGAVTVSALATTGSTQTTVGKAYTLPGVTFTAGMKFNVELQVTGTSPTTVNLKAWPTTATQPTSWQVSATDSTAALQSAGSVGVVSYLASSSTVSPVTMQVTSFSSGPTAGLPSGAFTANCSGLACSVDGTASTDPSGTISSYQWSWGDGVVTTGATSAHTFAVAGTYRITLTVTDSSGWTSVVTRTVTVPV